jgi:hypothetical protein
MIARTTQRTVRITCIFVFVALDVKDVFAGDGGLLGCMVGFAKDDGGLGLSGAPGTSWLPGNGGYTGAVGVMSLSIGFEKGDGGLGTPGTCVLGTSGACVTGGYTGTVGVLGATFSGAGCAGLSGTPGSHGTGGLGAPGGHPGIGGDPGASGPPGPRGQSGASGKVFRSGLPGTVHVVFHQSVYQFMTQSGTLSKLHVSKTVSLNTPFSTR